MPFYEVVYETGSYSVTWYSSDEEANQALKTHNDRAKSGEVGGPTGHPAERVAKVYVYAEHPAEYGEDQVVTQKDINAAVEGVSMEGQASAMMAAAAVRDVASPLKTEVTGHESRYKAKETKELALKL